MMIVSELIEQLQRMPQGVEVVVADDITMLQDHCITMTDIDSVNLDTWVVRGSEMPSNLVLISAIPSIEDEDDA